MHRLRFTALIVLIQAFTVNVLAQQFLRIGDLVQVNATGTIQGNALTATNAPLPDAAVRLRDARSGRIVDATRTDQTGLFVFRNVEPGTYIVELVGPGQSILAASDILNVNAGDTVSAIVKLPFRIQPYAGILGHSTMTAILVTATAAAAGVLATQVAGDAVSPRR